MQNDGLNGAFEGLKVLSERLAQNAAVYKVPKITENMAESLKSYLNFSVPKIEWIEELAKRFQALAAEAKESEGLSEDEFEARYAPEVSLAEEIGKQGWVISQFTGPNTIDEWHQALKDGKEDQIAAAFDGDEFPILLEIVDHLDNIYQAGREQRYYSKGKQFFDAEDYMTSAMYLTALIDYRVTKNVNFPKKQLKNKDKFSRKGFYDQLVDDYKSAPGFMTKWILFLNSYPSLIAFLNRLFVDGEYAFKNDKEPPYINRNWLLHGRCEREIQRYECIQLLNALSVFEFVTDKGDASI